MYLAAIELPGGDRTFERFETRELALAFIQELTDLELEPKATIYEVQ